MTEYLWGNKAKAQYVIIATVILLFAMLGAKPLWTMETRWADIVMNFFYRGDFFHPYLKGQPYYDKPLLSYWMMSFFYLFTKSAIALRLPSALAGAASVWAIKRLGEKLYNPQVGMIAAWMLLTTFYFVFFSRVASADMLNLTGVLLAVLWYALRKDNPCFKSYAVFFVIVALTSLCKGLLGFVLPVLIILPDIWHNKAWRAHARFAFFAALCLGVLIYCIPFFLSMLMGNSGYDENGFMLVFQENVVRFFHPFDHRGNLFTYLVYFPLYLLPWTFFAIPAAINQIKVWRALNWEIKWMYWAVLLVFCFFNLSLSRRSYYILPILPYAILTTAHWIEGGEALAARYRFAGGVASLFLIFSTLFFIAFVPLYYCGGGERVFAKTLMEQVSKMKPWDQWYVVLYGAPQRTNFYVRAHFEPLYFGLPGRYKKMAQKGMLRSENVVDIWPALKTLRQNQIVITDKSYEEAFTQALHGYQKIEMPQTWGQWLFDAKPTSAPVAFVPPK